MASGPAGLNGQLSKSHMALDDFDLGVCLGCLGLVAEGAAGVVFEHQAAAFFWSAVTRAIEARKTMVWALSPLLIGLISRPPVSDYL